ncbi:MAG: PilW family protein [Sulfuricaulis sp.]
MAGADSDCARGGNVVNTVASSSSVFYNQAMFVNTAGYRVYPGITGYEFTGTAPAASYSLPSTNPTADLNANDWNPQLDADIVGYASPGSDVVFVSYADPSGAVVPASPANDNTTSNIFVSSSALSQFNPGQLVVISDCNMSVMFEITGTTASPMALVHGGSGPSPTPGNSCTVWSDTNCLFNYVFQSSANSALGATISPIRAIAYAVGPDCSNAANGLALNQIYLSADSGTAGKVQCQPIVPGVENMQILYEVNTGTQASPTYQFYTADAVAAAGNWSNVMAVRFSLLVRTPQDNVDRTNDLPSFNVGGTTVTPFKDHRRRRVYTETVELRVRGV